MQHNTLPKHNQKLPFTRYDFGWVLLCIGMAIGAGTVLMPVQIGLKGIWVFITAAIIAYPATWVVQDIYLKTLSESDSCNDYTDIISHYLGKNWGIFLGVIYFLMIIHGIFIYSLSVVFDSASYLKTFGLTDADLSQSLLYKVAIFAVLVAIASGGERLLFKISRALAKLARATSNEKLSQAFHAHLEETHGQIERIDQVVESESNLKIKRMKCVAMEGLIEEANEVIESTEKNEVRDAALIAAAQKVEHYEIASYGTLATLAEQLGYRKAAKLLKETLEEEKATDIKLTDLALNNVNKKAENKA